MIKNLFKTLIIILTLFIIFIGYLSYFGFTTTKFNSVIKDKIKKQNSDLDIDLKKVKLHLDLKNIAIKIKTKNPKIIIKNSEKIELKEISSNILLSSYFQNKFAIKNLLIESKKNEVKNYINFYKNINNSLELILINQLIKQGKAQINIELNFDDSGKIKNDYKLSGKVLNAEIQVQKNKILKDLNFNFLVNDKNYKFEKILFKFNKINFNSEFLNIKQKNKKFHINGNLKNKKDKINNDIILLIFEDNLEIFDFSNTKFESTSEFNFDLSKKFRIKNLKIDTKLNLDELILKYDSNKIKNYIKNYNNLINLKQNKLHIEYSKEKVLIDGSSKFYIDENFDNSINFQIKKIKNKIDFKTLLNLDKIKFSIEDIAYKKLRNQNATLQVKGFKNNKKLLFESIDYKEKNNSIVINNLEINNNKISNVGKIKFDFLSKNNFKNQINLIKKDDNYELVGKSFDSIQLIENISDSEFDQNFFEIFENLNSNIKILVDEVKLDEKSTVNNLIAYLEVRNS